MAKPATHRAAAPSDPNRTKLIRAIRAACARKGIDDDDRRAIQQTIVPDKTSMSDMTPGQLGKLLDHFNRDWRGPNPDRAHIGKVRALWWSLYWLGAIHQPNDDALSAFVKRQTSIAHIRFLDHRQAHSVIEALKSWLERHGVMWWSDDDAHIRGIARPIADRLAVLQCLIGLARGVAVDDPLGMARATLRLASDIDVTTLGARDLDLMIACIGKEYRRRQHEGMDCPEADHET